VRLRSLLVVLAGVLVALSAFPAALVSATTARPAQLFVLAGQSNMLGRGMPVTLGAASSARLLVWREASSSWEIAKDPLGDPTDTDNGIGPGMTFGLGAIKKLRGTVGLVQCAVTGTRINQWVPSGSAYRSCLTAIRAAGGHVAAILFLQGESDAQSENNARAWSGRFNRMLVAFRTDLSENVPLVLGEIGNIQDSHFSFQAEVRKQQVQAAQSNTGVTLVTTLDLPMSPDGVHFTVNSYMEIGTRFAAAWWQLARARAASLVM
jgi:carbohydrate esterase-like sialic acid-specific acetylesterase